MYTHVHVYIGSLKAEGFLSFQFSLCIKVYMHISKPVDLIFLLEVKEIRSLSQIL